MKKGKNMINQKNDLNMITRKLETELPTFHFDGLEISEITTTTSWMKLHINVLFIKDDVQITKVLYKDYETGLWYYIKDNGMIISHKDTFNHTIKNLIDEMIYDCHVEIEEAEETKATEEAEEIEETTIETIPHVDVDCSNLKKVLKNSLYGMFGESQDTERDRIKYLMETHNYPEAVHPVHDRMSLPCRVCTHFCTRCDTDNYIMEYCCRKNKENEKKAIKNPEWHHVSLVTLANIDFDMLDEKRKVYLSFYKKWQEARKNLRKCSCGNSYERCCRVFRRSLTIALEEDRISKTLVEYFDRQISMVNVECGVWSSMVEVATGQHDSRKYNRATLRY